MSNGFEGKYVVRLSDTEVFPPGTRLTVTPAGENYQVEVTDAGHCGPQPSTLNASPQGSLLVTEAFTLKCPPHDFCTATLTWIGGNFYGGEVSAQGAYEESNGTPAGTYTAEEEGGDVEI